MYILCTEYIYVEHSLPECSTLFIPSLLGYSKARQIGLCHCSLSDFSKLCLET